MAKEWKVFASDNCPNCGNNLEVLSDCPEEKDTEFEQWFIDGEKVRCCSECGFESALSVDDGEAWIQEGNISELSAEDD